jgi:hypothetical protein
VSEQKKNKQVKTKKERKARKESSSLPFEVCHQRLLVVGSNFKDFDGSVRAGGG